MLALPLPFLACRPRSVCLATQIYSREKVSFGEFELNCRTGELRRNDSILKLQPQPAKVLAILVERAGVVVTRQELAEQLWGSDTYVDFEHGLNFAIRQVRSVLEDDAEHPRFLETVPKRGYRFIATVNEVSAPAPSVQDLVPPSPSRKSSLRYIALCVVIAAAGAGLMVAFHPERWRFTNRKRIESLAVLPLHNLSSTPEQQYFSDGMTDELITELAKIPRLRVISHTSVERYKDTKEALPAIARELGVDAVVEGTVLRSGDRVRISAQLIDARTDQHVWAESYERDLRDILSLQAEVSQQIAHQVGITLTAGEKTRLAAARVVDPAAHEAYLKGEFYWSQLTCDGFENALKSFQDAVAKDPSFAPAYAGMADSYFNLADWRCWPLDTFAKAEASAWKATELDPDFAGSRATLAELAFYHEWNWKKADEEFRKALELDPNAAGTYSSYAIYLVSMGQPERALANMQKAQKLDPVSEETNVTHAYLYYLAHQYDQAIEQAKKTLDLYPGLGAVYYWLGQSYEQKGMAEEAIAAYLKCRANAPNEVAALRSAYKKRGLPGYWLEERRLRKKAKKEVDPVLQAMYYSHTGEKEKAVQALRLGFEQHCDGLQFLKVEPVYDSLRDDPKFKELVAQLGF
jgi:TolB-like protein/DNA-binding winged helix-turn-helix (wHTH) protein/Tfp pilus assembly protein PilF